MKISVQLDNNQKEMEILIKTAVIDDSVNAIIEKLKDEKPKIMVGFMDGIAKVLNETHIIRVYSANKKVYAVTQNSEYNLKMPLYEVIQRVNQNDFVRISNTEIINLKQVVEFDLSFTGTICIKLSNGNISYVSRRYVTHIKQTLGIGGK